MEDDKGKKVDWFVSINEIEKKIGDVNELNYSNRKRTALMRKLISNSGLCIICGSKYHNELKYNHEDDEICVDCGFVHNNNSLCLFGRKHGDLKII